jgi:hypothetical protein
MQTLGLSEIQILHVKTLLRVVFERKLSKRAGVIVIETALVESNIKVYANQNVPESMHISHEAVGSDHLSVGIFQQQVPMWGTADDCMDPAKSCNKFLDRLEKFNWYSRSTGVVAQQVQGSAFPDRYQTMEQRAIQIVNAFWPTQHGVVMANLDQSDKDFIKDQFASLHTSLVSEIRNARSDVDARLKELDEDVEALKAKGGIK